MARRAREPEPPQPRRARGRSEDGPSFGPGELEALLRAAGRHFVRCGLRARREGDLLFVEGDPDFARHGLPLDELVDACRDAPPEQWESELEQRISLIRRTRAQLDALSLHKHDLANVRSLLIAPFFPAKPEHRGGLPLPVTASYLPGTLVALCYNLPRGPLPVPREDVEPWGLDDKALLQLALANVRATGRRTLTQEVLSSGARIWTISGADPLVATQALFLDEYIEERPQFGLLVGVPNQRTVLYHELLDETVVPAVEAMVNLIRRQCLGAPDPVSPALYWFNEDRFRELPYREGKADEGGLRPPPEFLTVTQRLMRKPKPEVEAPPDEKPKRPRRWPYRWPR